MKQQQLIPADPMDALPSLPIGRYHLHCVAVDALRLPDFPGSAWRGLFGHALKRSVCITHEPDCQRCLLLRTCVYPYLFETPPPRDSVKMTRYNNVPRPFVLGVDSAGPRELAVGDRLHLEVTLIGRANGHLPYVIHAFQRAGGRGIGSGRGRFELRRIERCSLDDAGTTQTIWEQDGELAPPVITAVTSPPCPAQPRLQFTSPLRLKRAGHLLKAEEFAFHDLFRNLLRRISMLSYFHTDHPLEVDFADLAQRSRGVGLVAGDLHWCDWTRYSSRQHTAMKMGGLMGWAELDGADLTEFWPYLWLGQWIHAGKGTSMGLGGYRITDAASLPGDTVGRI